MMNEINAEVTGTISEVLVDDGDRYNLVSRSF